MRVHQVRLIRSFLIRSFCCSSPRHSFAFTPPAVVNHPRTTFCPSQQIVHFSRLFLRRGLLLGFASSLRRSCHHLHLLRGGRRVFRLLLRIRSRLTRSGIPTPRQQRPRHASFTFHRPLLLFSSLPSPSRLFTRWKSPGEYRSTWIPQLSFHRRGLCPHPRHSPMMLATSTCDAGSQHVDALTVRSQL